MPNIYNESPFYERDNLLKNYYKLLAVPGRYAQASEFTEIQSLLLGCIKSIGDSLFNEGNIQSGCEVVLNGTEVTITPGRIYLDGVVRDTVESKVQITGVGIEHITARISENLITEDMDDSLYDPAVGTSTAYQPGCFRVHQEVVFEVNGDGYSIATLENGAMQNFVVEKPQMDVISEVLARRTFAESGNYVVDGFMLKDLDYEENGRLLVGLTKGQAFIKGYEVYRPVDTTFYVDKATTLRPVVGEPKQYSTDSKAFELINNPVNQVSKVFVTLTHSETLVYNNLVAEYPLQKTPVADITSVTTSGRTLIKGTDYKLSNNKLIFTGTSVPTNGTNFEVKYNYKCTLVENTDYKVHRGDKTIVEIVNTTMLNNSEVLIDYDYYLARMDTICLDNRGNAIVIKGLDNDSHLCYAPEVHDLSYLSIGTIFVYPNSEQYDIINDTVRVSTMQRIQNAIERLDKIEYNLTMTTLDQEFLTQENSEQLRGMFTEAFINYDRIDNSFEDVRLSIDPETGRMLPYFEDVPHALSVSNASTNRYGVIGDVYTLPYSKVKAISQNETTGTMLVNPYQAFDPIMTVNITPSVDTWVNVHKTTTTQTRTVYRNYAWWSDYNRNRNTQTTQHSLGEVVTSESSSVYMRQRDVTIISKTFPYESKNVRCTFNGIPVALRPLNTTRQGDSSGSVRPDINGLLEAVFTIPANVKCGTVEVKLYDANLVGYAQYRATGIERNVRETILVTNSVARYVDPLAQTFVFSETRILTGADVFLMDKDSHNVTIQVRNVETGLPGKIVYTEVAVPAKDIPVSSNGNSALHVDFPNAIQCEKDTEYCIVILTDSPKLRAFIAKLGEKTLSGSKYITSNPYATGVLLSSSNASTWTPHQDMDLKFALYTAKFESTGEINFNSFNMDNADRLLYTIDILNGISTSTDIQSKINNGAYQSVQPWEAYELDTHAKSCQVRIKMTSSSQYQSPLINRDSAQVISFHSENSATYITKNMILNDECQEVKVMFNTSSLPGNDVKVYIATDGIGQAWTELTPSASYPIDAKNKQLEYVKNNLKISNFRIKIVISTTNTCSKPYISKLGVILNESL